MSFGYLGAKAKTSCPKNKILQNGKCVKPCKNWQTVVSANTYTGEISCQDKPCPGKNKQRDSNTGKCVKMLVSPGAGTTIAPIIGVIKTVLPSGKTCKVGFQVGPNGKTCKKICPNWSTYNAQTLQCIPKSCAGAKYRDTTTGKCVKNPVVPGCATGQIKDALGQCVSIQVTCPTGTTKDFITGNCIPLGGGGVISGCISLADTQQVADIRGALRTYQKSTGLDITDTYRFDGTINMYCPTGGGTTGGCYNASAGITPGIVGIWPGPRDGYFYNPTTGMNCPITSGLCIPATDVVNFMVGDGVYGWKQVSTGYTFTKTNLQLNPMIGMYCATGIIPSNYCQDAYGNQVLNSSSCPCGSALNQYGQCVPGGSPNPTCTYPYITDIRANSPTYGQCIVNPCQQGYALNAQNQCIPTQSSCPTGQALGPSGCQPVYCPTGQTQDPLSGLCTLAGCIPIGLGNTCPQNYNADVATQKCCPNPQSTNPYYYGGPSALYPYGSGYGGGYGGGYQSMPYSPSMYGGASFQSTPMDSTDAGIYDEFGSTGIPSDFNPQILQAGSISQAVSQATGSMLPDSRETDAVELSMMSAAGSDNSDLPADYIPQQYMSPSPVVTVAPVEAPQAPQVQQVPVGIDAVVATEMIVDAPISGSVSSAEQAITNKLFPIEQINAEEIRAGYSDFGPYGGELSGLDAVQDLLKSPWLLVLGAGALAWYFCGKRK